MKNWHLESASGLISLEVAVPSWAAVAAAAALQDTVILTFILLFAFLDSAPLPTTSAGVQFLKVPTGTSESLLPRCSFGALRNLILYLTWFLLGSCRWLWGCEQEGSGTLPGSLSGLNICWGSAVGWISDVNVAVTECWVSSEGDHLRLLSALTRIVLDQSSCFRALKWLKSSPLSLKQKLFGYFHF